MKKRKCKNKVVVFRIVKLSYSMKTTTMKYCIIMKMVRINNRYTVLLKFKKSTKNQFKA